MTDSTQAQTLISYFQKKYEERFGKKPLINRNKIQNPLKNILKDLTVAQVKKLIDFYIRTDKDPKLIFLCYEYDEVSETMIAHEKDLERRRALIRQTQKNVEEFRRRYGAN